MAEKKSYRFDLETQGGRVRALEFYRKWILPKFPQYFEDLFRKREEEGTWHEMSICWDVFQVFAYRPQAEDLSKHDGIVICTIPAPRGFWDAWLMIYCLESPEIFSNLSVCAKLLLKYLDQLKMEPENFESVHMDYLIRLAKGEGDNFFLKDPRELVFLLRSYPMIEVASGGLNWEVVLRKPEMQDQLEKLRKETYEDVEEFF